MSIIWVWILWTAPVKDQNDKQETEKLTHEKNNSNLNAQILINRRFLRTLKLKTKRKGNKIVPQKRETETFVITNSNQIIAINMGNKSERFIQL